MTSSTPPPDPERQRVGWDEVLAEAHVDSGREVPLTRIGYNLARFLLAYVGVVSLVLLLDYLLHFPSPPEAASLTPQILADYEKLSQLYTDRILDLFDQLVIKSMLPVLTAVLGYIFGIRGVEKDNS